MAASDSFIHAAAYDGDVDGLRQALDSGVSPDTKDSKYGFTPLHSLCERRSVGGELSGDRVACMNLLIARGANVNAANGGNVRPLQFAIFNQPGLVPLLLDAGADPNRASNAGESTLEVERSGLDLVFMEDRHRDSRVLKAMVQALVSAGAEVNPRDDSGRTLLEKYWDLSEDAALKIYPILFRAGAALPTREHLIPGHTDRHRGTGTCVAYVRKIRAAGGFKRYERNHLNAITATFAPKLSHVLPPELVRRVVEYAFHVGDY